MKHLTKSEKAQIRDGTLERNKAIKLLCQVGYKQALVGKWFGMPRQRIFQIVRRENGRGNKALSNKWEV